MFRSGSVAPFLYSIQTSWIGRFGAGAGAATGWGTTCLTLGIDYLLERADADNTSADSVQALTNIGIRRNDCTVGIHTLCFAPADCGAPEAFPPGAAADWLCCSPGIG